jgi:hypothetical protein
MLRPALKATSAALGALMLLGGCAAQHYGIVSAPYVGDAPPPPAAGYINRYFLPPVQVEGASIEIDLLNAVRTRMCEVVLFVVPVNFSRKHRPLYGDWETTRVSLRITPEAEGMVLRPLEARITIDGSTVAAARAEYSDLNQPIADRMQPVVAGMEFRLGEPGRADMVILEFDVPRPLPTQSVELDLSRALVAPGLPLVPPIRFRIVRWTQGFA